MWGFNQNQTMETPIYKLAYKNKSSLVNPDCYTPLNTLLHASI